MTPLPAANEELPLRRAALGGGGGLPAHGTLAGDSSPRLLGRGRRAKMATGLVMVLLFLLLRQGASRGARETVLGTLGKATFLRIPLEFQELTVSSGEAVWKRDTEDPHRKLVLLKYLDGNYTNYMQEKTRFHRANFSLEILNTSRQDRQLYEYIISKGRDETVWQIQLEVYEPVSAPRIQVLSRTLANGSCTVTLECVAERGDRAVVAGGWAQNSTFAFSSGAKREREPLAEDGTMHTIYSQVQRVEKPKGPRGPPAAEYPACTTIYAEPSEGSNPGLGEAGAVRF
nr:PREDICTED: signaling lymphocytic activation molecule [Apteryx mantelli mantelli]